MNIFYNKYIKYKNKYLKLLQNYNFYVKYI